MTNHRQDANVLRYFLHMRVYVYMNAGIYDTIVIERRRQENWFFFSYYSWMSFFMRLFVLVSVHERLLSLKDHLSRLLFLHYSRTKQPDKSRNASPSLSFLFFCFNHFYPRHTVQLRCNILNNQNECTDMSVGE